jgi:hypothetical protein
VLFTSCHESRPCSLVDEFKRPGQKRHAEITLFTDCQIYRMSLVEFPLARAMGIPASQLAPDSFSCFFRFVPSHNLIVIQFPTVSPRGQGLRRLATFIRTRHILRGTAYPHPEHALFSNSTCSSLLASSPHTRIRASAAPGTKHQAPRPSPAPHPPPRPV